MQITEEMKEKINKFIEENELDYEYEFIGLRVQDVPFEIGETNHISHVWIDNEDTGEELDGICVTRIDELGRELYCGDHAAILVSNYAEGGEDYGELILKDAKVVMILS